MDTRHSQSPLIQGGLIELTVVMAYSAMIKNEDHVNKKYNVPEKDSKYDKGDAGSYI